MPLAEPVAHWTAYFQAFTTSVVTILAGYIAWRQWKTAQNKLRLELFEKRLAIFNAAVSFSNDVLDDLLDQDGLSQYEAALGNAQWLFDERLVAYMQNLYRISQDMTALRLGTYVGAEASSGAESDRLHEALKAELRFEIDGRVSAFRPFLQLGH